VVFEFCLSCFLVFVQKVKHQRAGYLLYTLSQFSLTSYIVLSDNQSLMDTLLMLQIELG
jgi:hypothetical protein